MKLYLLKVIDVDGYDILAGVVIRAKDARQARRIASKEEYDPFWDTTNLLDPKRSTCEQLKPEGKSGIILSDYRAG